MGLRSLEGKVVAMTGGGGGIGRATAFRCAELGATGIALCDTNMEAMSSVKKDLLEQYELVQVTCTVADVSKGEEVDAWTEGIMKDFGKLDGAVNIAGISKRTADTNMSNIKDEDWAGTVAVNLTGTMNCLRAQMKHITKPGGSIVNISSGAGLRGVKTMGSYSATKFGQRGLTKTAAIEFGPQGVRVNTVMPGLVHSGENFDKAAAAGLFDPAELVKGVPLMRMGKPYEIANAVAFLLSEDASYITGIDIAVDGGVNNS